MVCSRRDFLLGSLAGLSTLSMGCASLRGARGLPEQPNVLFIAVDDLKPALGCYGSPLAQTPNIDRLAESGMMFSRAYCQQAVCSPSRTSLLTGRRPDTTKVYDLETHFRKNIPDVVTLPEHFKGAGYYARSFGKIFHGGLDDPQSWSEESWRPRVSAYGPGAGQAKKLADEAKVSVDKQIRAQRMQRIKKKGPRLLSWLCVDCADNELPDGAVADEAILTMREAADRPFFLAVGFYKPHLPFVAPKRYFDLYADTEFPLPDFITAPEGAPLFAGQNGGELRQYTDIWGFGSEPLDDKKTLELIRAYHAAASYTDAQIGRVLDELDAQGLRENTVVVLWGDHGWHLGDHGFWCKHTNYEQAVHVPMIFRAPGLGEPGVCCDALVEFVDIYPTLCQLCGLPLPEGLEGCGMAPLFDDPGRPWKLGAFSQYPRSPKGAGRLMGYSVRNERYRLTEWAKPEKDFCEVELYDYEEDPGETVNLAAKPGYEGVVSELTAILHGGWQGALPTE